jgi:hypothetical protein
MLIPLLPHMHFFHFDDTCYLGSNGSTKFLEFIIAFDSFLKAVIALVLDCYATSAILYQVVRTTTKQ